MSTTNFDRYDLNTTGDNVREDLTDVIYNISPTETPAVSNFEREDVAQVLHEWETDALATASSANAAIDGADFGTDSSSAAVRRGNYCQISIKYLAVSRRADIIKKAGRKSELAYQVAKKGKELRRDVESSVCANLAAVAGTASAASISAGLCAYLRTNTARGLLGTDPTLSGTTFGTPVAAAGDGTTRALSQATLLTVLKNCYVAGGNPNMLMMDPTCKQNFSSFMFSGSTARIATQYQDQGANPRGGVSVVGAVDVYVTDFTVIDVVPNRFQRSRDVFALDTEFWAIGYLDGYKTEEISKIGDASRRHILVDWVLVGRNEASSGIVADINTGTPMVA